MRHLQPASPVPETELTHDGAVTSINYTHDTELEVVSKAIQWIYHILPSEKSFYLEAHKKRSNIFNWLLKRRRIRTRWCKKADNWLALIKFACAHIVFDMALYG